LIEFEKKSKAELKKSEANARAAILKAQAELKNAEMLHKQ